MPNLKSLLRGGKAIAREAAPLIEEGGKRFSRLLGLSDESADALKAAELEKQAEALRQADAEAKIYDENNLKKQIARPDTTSEHMKIYREAEMLPESERAEYIKARMKNQLLSEDIERNKFKNSEGMYRLGKMNELEQQIASSQENLNILNRDELTPEAIAQERRMLDLERNRHLDPYQSNAVKLKGGRKELAREEGAGVYQGLNVSDKNKLAGLTDEATLDTVYDQRFDIAGFPENVSSNMPKLSTPREATFGIPSRDRLTEQDMLKMNILSNLSQSPNPETIKRLQEIMTRKPK